MQDQTRRDMLKMLLAGMAVGWAPCRAMALAQVPAGDWPAADVLQAAFAGVVEGAEQYWRPAVGAARAQQMGVEARAAFAAQLPGLPEVGASDSPDAMYIPVAAWFVALYRPMRAVGMDAEDVGRIVYQLYRYQLGQQDPTALQAEGERLFAAQAQFRRWAETTLRREYPANWVAHFVPGDGKHFDFGYDYTECGVVKYLRAQGVPELAAFVCLNDFSKSAAQGTGLVRSQTLAQGDACCNFRYRKGRVVTQGWDSEIALIRARQARFGPA